MRTYSFGFRVTTWAVVALFAWSYGPLFQLPTALAAEKQKTAAKEQALRPVNREQRPEEKFEGVLAGLREEVNTAGEKNAKGEDDSAEMNVIRAKKTELDGLAEEIRAKMAATEKKIASLPKEIRERHRRFAAHFEDNLRTLNANLADAEAAKTKFDRKAKIEKVRLHLEKTKAPSRHQGLDPTKPLPFSARKAKAPREPRLKKEQFEKDFPPQRSRRSPRIAQGPHDTGYTVRDVLNHASGNMHRASAHKPVLLAFNEEFTSDAPLQLPLPTRGEGWPVPYEARPLSGGEGTIPHSEFRIPNLSAFSDSSPIILAQATTDLPTADDLSETQDIRFSPELRQIANLLENNPVQLFEFVRNNFSSDFYYGAVRGSQGTLLLQNGNDLDQVSTLIGLFRISGIPARYVIGTAEIPIEKVMKWVGVTKPELAAQVLVSNGIPAKVLISGGSIKAVQVERVWAEVYISYANYRGIINDPSASKTWIPLDPAFKFIEPNPDAIDLADSQQFDIDNYLSNYLQTVKPTTPAKDYLKATIDYVAANIPDKIFYDLLLSNTIADKVLGLLPDTLPYPVKTVGGKFSVIPDSYRHHIALEFTNPNTNETVLNYTASWTSVLHNRFTLSYAPATVSDEQTIANYGDIYSTPSYLIQVKPVLMVEGVTVAEGTAVPMASNLTCRMNFIWPDGTIDKAVTNSFVAGAPYAIGLGSGYTTGRIVTNRTAKLEAAVNTGQIGEPLVGEYLNLFAVNYLQELDSSRKLIAKSMKTLDTNRTAELMVGVDLRVLAVFGIPKAVDIRGVLIDVDYNTATPVNIDGDQNKVRRFQILAGMTSSALEHSMFESIIGVEAISTIKALEIANVQGIPVHQIDLSNIAAKLPLLQLNSEVKTDIQNAVNAGKVVKVSERNIQLNNWNGVGYIVLEPATGAGAYMISSGLAGGELSWITADLQYMISTHRMTSAQAKQWILDHQNKIWFPAPVIGPIKSHFGKRSISSKLHSGIDYAVDIGTPVYAVADGTVIRVENSSSEGYGNVIYIDHGAGVVTLYGHNCSIEYPYRESNISNGVSARNLLAYSGNTGHVWTGSLGDYLPDTFPRCVSAEGAHLHFEIRLNGKAVDPENFIMTL